MIDQLGDIGIGSIFLVLAITIGWMVKGQRSLAYELKAPPPGDPSSTINRQIRLRSRGPDPGRLIVEGQWEELEDAIVGGATSGGAWRAGGAFTGVALLITFFLIGYVLHSKLGKTIGADQIDNKLLAEAVSQMGSKFWVSAAGVAATLVHGMAAGVLRARSLKQVRTFLETARAEGRMVSATEHEAQQRTAHEAGVTELLRVLVGTADRQHQQLDGLRLSSIGLERGVTALVDKTEQGFAAQRTILLESADFMKSIDDSLQGGLEPLVSNVDKLAKNLLSEKAEEFLTRIDETFRAGLKTGLSDVVVPLEQLRVDIKSVSPDQALRDIADRLHGAITGGASDSTSDFKRSMDEMQRSLPAMVASMNEAAETSRKTSMDAMSGFQQLLSEQHEGTRRANEQVLASVTAVLQRVDGVSSSMADVVAELGAQSGADMQRMLAGLDQQAQQAIERVMGAAASADVDARARRSELVAQDEAAFIELLGSVRVLRDEIVTTESKTMGLLERIRLETSSVVELLSSERQAIDQVLGGVRAGAQSLTAQSASAQKVSEATQLTANALNQSIRSLVERTAAEKDLVQASGDRVSQIREGREEVESSLLRVTKAVADLLSKELQQLRVQSDVARQSMESLVAKVDGNIVSSLAAQVEDLAETVKSLDTTVRLLGERTR